MRTAMLSLLGVLAMTLVGCETSSPNSPANRTGVRSEADIALRQMTAQDPKLQDVLNSAYAYAIFPNVGEAAAGIGGASGRGVVYQNGQVVGTAKLDQLSVGPQAGGQSYSELIVFKDQNAFDHFKNGNLEFGAQATATVVKAGAAGTAPFANGVAVYILPKGGLEVGANISGQKLSFTPSSNNGM